MPYDMPSEQGGDTVEHFQIVKFLVNTALYAAGAVALMGAIWSFRDWARSYDQMVKQYYALETIMFCIIVIMMQVLKVR